jgi:UDP-2-acetamido-2,6-beta-L-arabino-hexul-4-ose reductase
MRPVPVSAFQDQRGTLWKVLSCHGFGPNKAFGELYACLTKNGAVRGCHYHRTTTEWFYVVQGSMRCRLILPETQIEKEYLLKGEQPEVLEVPPGVAHSLTTESQEPALLIAYADRPYDEADPDLVPYRF